MRNRFSVSGPLAATYREAVVWSQLSGPYTLIGWSMGGLIALEIARLLRSEARGSVEVIMLDT